MSKFYLLTIFIFLNLAAVGQCPTTSILTLPYLEDFEDASGSSMVDNPQIHCDALGSWTFETTAQNGGRISFQLGYSHSGSKAATMDRNIGVQLMTNFLTGTFNMSGYDTSNASHVVLDFWHLDHGDGPHANDKVWIRGNPSETWVEIYDLDAHGVSGIFVHADNLNITNALKSAGQNFSSQFQIRFGQQDHRRASSLTGLSGRTFDDIRMVADPCPQVGNITYSSIDPTSGTVSFDGAGSYEVEVGNCGFTQGNGSIFSGSAPLTITGLNPQTCYDIYVRRNCSTNGFSSWSGPFSITTACLPVSAPYLETFDGAGWVASSSGNGTGDMISSCWSRNPAPPMYSWVVRSGSTPTTGTGPMGDHTTGNGNYMATETDNPPYFVDAELYTPMVDLSSLSVPQVNFYYHMFGSTEIDTLFVDVWSNGVWHNEVLALDQQVSSSGSPWLNATLHLSAYSDTVQLRFRIYNASGNNKRDAAIDDISFEEGLNCPTPIALSASNITDSTAMINWSSPVANQWYVIYDTAGFDPAQGGRIDTVTSKPHLLEGLYPSIPYDVYVIGNCGLSGVSDTSLPFTFRTTCNQAFAAPYFQGFEYVDSYTFPTCWTGIDPVSVNSFRVVPAGGIPAASGSQFFNLSTYTFHNRNDTVMLITPRLKGISQDDKQVRFKIYGPTTLDVVVVSLPTTDPNSGFTALDTVSITGGTPYQEFTVHVNSTNGHNLTDEFIGLRFLADPGSYIYIDDFWYEVADLCSEVTNISLQDYSDTSATFTFSSQYDSVQYEWGLKGFVQGNGSLGTETGNSIDFSNLQPGTSYEFYIKSLCPLGNSPWQGPFSFKTLCGDPQPLTLPYLEDFESLPVDTFNLPGYIKCDSISALEFIKPMGYAEGRSYINSTPGRTHSGNRALTFDAGSSSLNPVNKVLWRLNMSNYSAPHTFPIELSMYMHIEAAIVGDSDRVFIRGSEADPWIEVMNVIQSFGTANKYRRIGDIYVDSILAQNGQNFSSTFQVKITEGSRSAQVAGYNDWRTYDDLLLQEIFCEGPTDLGTRSTTSTSATVFWSTSANGSVLEYGPAGFIPGQGILVSTADTFAIINGLNPATTYDFYLRDTCSGGQLSKLSGSSSFITDCNTLPPVTLPFHDGFENLSGIHQHQAIFCEPDHQWKFESDHWNTRLTFSTDPNHVNTGNTAATLDQASYFATTPSSLILFVNLANYSSVPQINLSFSYLHHNQVNDPNNRVWVRSSDTAAWIQIYDLDANKGTTGVFKDVQNVDIVSPLINNGQSITDNVQIRFGQHGSGPHNFWTNTDGLTFDDIWLEELACAYPTNLNARNISDTSAMLSWTPTVGSTGYQQVWFGADGFYQGPGTTGGTQIIANDSLLMTNLQPNTCYEFMVRAFCPPSNTSTWQGPFKFCTICTPYTAPYAEDFDNLTLPDLPTCWHEVDNNNDDLYTVFGTNHGVSIPSSPYAVEFNDGRINGNPPDTAMLITPSFSDLPSGANQIRFKVSFQNPGAGSALYIGTMSEPYNSSSFVPYDTLLSQDYSTSFTEVAIWLDDLGKIGNNTHVAFMHGASTYEIYMDDFFYEPIPTCVQPSSPQVGSITSNSALLSWTPFSGGNQFEISYGPGLSNPAAGNRIFTSGSSYNLTGLNSSTTYCYYVREVCAAGVTSMWSSSACFQTACGDMALPHLETFEGLSLGNSPVFDNCWEDISPNIPYWTVQISDGSDKNTSNTGPLDDHTYGGLQSGKYIFLESNGAGDSASIQTPWIDISSGVQPELSYWYYMYGAGIGALHVWLDTGNGYTKVQAITGQQQNSQSDPWLKSTVAIPAADSVRLKFTGIVGTSSAWLGDIALDDVAIYDAAAGSCSTPTGLSSTGNGCGSMTMLWSGTGNAIGYEIEYGQSLSAPGTGTRIYTTSSPHALTNLTGGSQYCVFVRQICATGDTSAWSSSYCFNTSTVNLTFPYLEDFENTSTGGGFGFSNCWESSTITAPNWMVEISNGNNTNSMFTGPIDDHTQQGLAAGKYIFLETTGGNNGDQSHLTSPWIDVSSARDLKLSYWYHMHGNGMGDLQVLVNSGSGFTLINTISGQQQSNQTDPWLQGLHSLPQSDSIQIRFTGINGPNGRSDMALDDIELYDDAACLPPTGFTGTGVGCDSASFVWDMGSPGSLLQYGPAGFTPGNGTMSMFFSDSTATITLLQPGTTYDFYIADTCMGDTSAFAGPISITTDSIPKPIAAINLVMDSAMNGEVHYWLNAQYNNHPVQYFWDFGNGQTANGPSTKAIYTNNGNHLITLIVSGPCGADTAHMLINVMVSLIDQKSYGLEVYPNPTDNHLTVKLDKQTDVMLRIQDVSGRQVIHHWLDFSGSNQQQIDLSRLPAGTYMLQLTIDNAIHRQILVVQ